MKPNVERMRHKVTFLDHVDTPDGYGGRSKTWEARFTSSAEITFQRGDEGVHAGQRADSKMLKIRIHQCVSARAIRPDWRVRDARSGETYNITSADAVSDPEWVWIKAIDIKAQAGET